jgi:lysine-ketoglutarate reductase/saccharopine dehydrogenase-like protein (TIGR00300 family)
MSTSSPSAPTPPCVQEVEIRGHIIDSLILPKVLDAITARGGSFQIRKITIGQNRSDPSYALVEVSAGSPEQLAEILDVISDHGAAVVGDVDCRLVPADVEGAFPEGFYSSTNQRTEVRVGGGWIPVADQEMDCGVAIDPAVPAARCIPMSEAANGQLFVVGHAGVRVYPEDRREEAQGFEFMSSAVSTEKPKGVAIRQIALDLHRARQEGRRTLLVGGPAIVHTGSIEHLCRLIRGGYISKLFAGNALATHDIEHALYGTSLGVQLQSGHLAEAGHEHHLRAINHIRRAGESARRWSRAT